MLPPRAAEGGQAPDQAPALLLFGEPPPSGSKAYLGTGLKNKVAAEEAVERVMGESHGAQPGLGDEAGIFDGEAR